MSGYKPVGAELLYAACPAGTVSVVSASAVTITAGYPAIEVPPGYFDKTGGPWTSSLKFLMGGLLIATATVPTFNFGLYAGVQSTSAPAFATTNTIVTTGTFTPTATTGCMCEMVVEILVRSIGLGIVSTLVGWGKLTGSAVNTAGYTSLPANAATYSPTATAIDVTQGLVLWPGLTLGAATAGNTFTAEYVKLYGEN